MANPTNSCHSIFPTYLAAIEAEPLAFHDIQFLERLLAHRYRRTLPMAMKQYMKGPLKKETRLIDGYLHHPRKLHVHGKTLAE